MNLLLIFLGLSLGNAAPVLAQTPISTSTSLIYSTTTAREIITAAAIKYGTSPESLFDTLQCESDLDPAAAGDLAASTVDSSKMVYTSFGIAQLHLPAHPEITKAEALDPLWAINWTAKEFAAGDADLWSCYRKENPSN